MFENIGDEMGSAVLIDSVDVIALSDLLVHLLKLFYNLVPLSTSDLFESLYDRVVHFEE